MRAARQVRFSRIAVIALAGAALFAACLDDKNPPLANEAPNRNLIYGQGSGGGGVGGGPGDNCECVSAYVVSGSDCAKCIVNQLMGTVCATEFATCDADGGSSAGGAGGGGAGPESCSDVRHCVNGCNGDAACAIACIEPPDVDTGHTDYNALLTCLCGACGSVCRDPGVSCGSGIGGGTTFTTTPTTP
jgi:hypothetical protein